MNYRSLLCTAAVLAGGGLPGQDPDPKPKPTPQKRVAVTDPAIWQAALRALGKRHAKARTITADYRQERTTVLLKRPLISNGRLLLRREPACMVFRAAGKRPTTIRLTYQHYEVLRPTRKTLERTPLADRSLPEALFQSISPAWQQLTQSFTVAKAWRVGADLVIEFRPKTDRSRFLQTFTIALDERRQLLRRIGYRDPQGDRVTLHLDNLQLDPKLPDDAFELRAPAGTRVLVHQPVGKQAR